MAHENEGPNTIFAGESNPNAARNTMWGFLLVVFIVAPIALITAFSVFLTFSLGRISHKVLAGFTALYAVILFATGHLISSFYAYTGSWGNLMENLELGMPTSAVILNLLWQQLPISILVGGIAGTIISAWRYFRRPSWVEIKFRLSPYQVFMKHKNIKDIRSNKNGPPDGRTLGINDLGEKIVQTEREASAHTFVVGATGSGKTTTLLLGARDSIRRGESYVFVDMKGSSDVPPALADYAERYGRPFYHWTSHDARTPYTGPAKNGPAYYDPLGRGDATRRTDLLLAGRDWSEDHYKIIIQDYLQRAFDISLGVPAPSNVDAIADIMTLLDPMELKKRSLHVVGDPYYDTIIAEINHLTERKIDKDVAGSLDGMRRQLGILRDSIQGRWLRKDPNGENNIVLFDVAHAGAVVVFTIDSGNYKQNAQLIGNLIIQDLMTVASELRNDMSRYPLNIIIDEFSAIGTDNIVSLIARCRDANIPVTLATQSLGDLKVVSHEFMEQIIGIIVSVIIHRANSLGDAEILAGLIGKEKQQVFRQGVEHTAGFLGIGKGSGTGKGTLEIVEEFKVLPARIQELGPGEMYYLCKSPNRLEKVYVITEDSKIVSKNSDSTKKAKSVMVPEDKTYQPSSYIPSGEKDKYTVDPSINGKTTYANDDFEIDFAESQVIHKSDPARIREILNRKEHGASPRENNHVEKTSTQPLSMEKPPLEYNHVPENPFEDESESPAYNDYSSVQEVPDRIIVEQKKAPPALPAIKPSVGLPPIQKREIKRDDIRTLAGLPKITPVAKPVGTKPIRPRRDGDIALPVIFPTTKPTKTVKTPPFTTTPKVDEQPTYGVSDWDDL